jgi:hypothetical protein
MKQSHKRWVFVLAILPILLTILFLYLYLFQNHDEAMSTDPINLMPTVPPNILPPTPRIKIPNTIHQLSPAGVTLSTPFPPNSPVGKLV